MSRSKSILLQVAFKEAASAILGTTTSITEKTQEYFDALLSLHEANDIAIEDDSNRGGGRSFTKSSKPAKELPSDALVFTAQDGTQWIDYRAAKASDQVIARHPDFKVKGGQGSEWLFKQDGTENPVAVELAQAADAMASLAAPM